MPWIQVGSGGLAWASPGSATGASSSRTMSRRFMLGTGRLHELAHLLAELGEALLGLGGPRELLGREHSADLERGLSAVLRELVAELADAPEQRLQVGGLDRAGSQQLVAQLLLDLAELLDERARGGAVRGQDPAHLRLLLGREVGRADHQPQLAVRPAHGPARALEPAAGAGRGRLGDGHRRGRGDQEHGGEDRSYRQRALHGAHPVRAWSSSRAITSRLRAASSAITAGAIAAGVVVAGGSPLTENSAAETSARIAATSWACMEGGTGVTARQTATSTQISRAAATAASPTVAGIQRTRRAGAGRVPGSGVSRSTPVIRASSPRICRCRAAHAAQPARCARSATEASSASTRSSASSERQRVIGRLRGAGAARGSRGRDGA